MGLSQSLYTGWTGLATHQRGMDNLSNNLANVNTIGYKKNDFLFSNLFKQALTVGGIPSVGDRSALNPKSLGLGVTTGAILHNFTGGDIEPTGNPLECAIEGNGFFMVDTAGGMALTRNGSFWTDMPGTDGLRSLCMGGGSALVQGWNAVDGVVTAGGATEDIRIPAVGDLMPGVRTENVSLTGVLPTNTSTADFAGAETATLALMGNLPGSGAMETRIYVPVTQTDGTTSTLNGEIREVKVRIDFTGPVANGDVNDWTWTMTTVDWPNAGDPGVRIYPPADDPAFTQGTMGFFNQGNALNNTGEGQPAGEGRITPGGTDVSAETLDADGNTVTTSFTLSGDFTMDIARMTNMAEPPVDRALGAWFVDGNPTGTMRRTIPVIDEAVGFESVTDANGVTTMEAVRRMEARENSLIFTPGERTESGAAWSWTSSIDGASGELAFNTDGDLVSSSQSGGGEGEGIRYDFDSVIHVGQAGAMRLQSQDGYRDGVLQTVSIDRDGKIWGRYSNLETMQLAQLAVATVANPHGLSGSGGTLFYPNDAVSGPVQVGTANGDNGSGAIRSNALEGSNVQLAQEFTNIISIERGYQFNSRIVTTSDEMLQTAVQLKR